MKKVTVILMAAAMLFTAGCGNSEKVIDGNVQNLDSGKSQAEESTGEAEDASQEEESVGSAHAEKGYVFYYDGTAVEMDVEAGPVIEKLGEPVSYFESQSCAFDGLDKTYTYNGFEIDTYPSSNKDYVFTVVLRDDTVATPEGIAIGDSVEKLKEAYPENSEEGTMIVCEKDGMKLCFIIQDDKVAAIEYRSSAWYNTDF